MNFVLNESDIHSLLEILARLSIHRVVHQLVELFLELRFRLRALLRVQFDILCEPSPLPKYEPVVDLADHHALLDVEFEQLPVNDVLALGQEAGDEFC